MLRRHQERKIVRPGGTSFGWGPETDLKLPNLWRENAHVVFKTTNRYNIRVGCAEIYSIAGSDAPEPDGSKPT
jgi:hypothetical protein